MTYNVSRGTLNRTIPYRTLDTFLPDITPKKSCRGNPTQITTIFLNRKCENWHYPVLLILSDPQKPQWGLLPGVFLYGECFQGGLYPVTINTTVDVIVIQPSLTINDCNQWCQSQRTNVAPRLIAGCCHLANLTA